MRVKEVNLLDDLGKRVKILSGTFKGATGSLTNPFSDDRSTKIGVFLDIPIKNQDIVNLADKVEIEFIDNTISLGD